MVAGLRVVFRPNPVSRVLYGSAVPASGTRGSVTSIPTAGGIRTWIHGPGGGLVYVRWDHDGSVCGVSPHDLKLEPDD
jgi:hypothetical protein